MVYKSYSSCNMVINRANLSGCSSFHLTVPVNANNSTFIKLEEKYYVKLVCIAVKAFSIAFRLRAIFSFGCLVNLATTSLHQPSFLRYKQYLCPWLEHHYVQTGTSGRDPPPVLTSPTFLSYFFFIIYLLNYILMYATLNISLLTRTVSRYQWGL